MSRVEMITGTDEVYSSLPPLSALAPSDLKPPTILEDNDSPQQTGERIIRTIMLTGFVATLMLEAYLIWQIVKLWS